MAAIYGQIEAPLADAYRTTARAVRREQNREAFIDARYTETLAGLAGNPMAKTTAYWSLRPVAPLAEDMVCWVQECDADPDATLANALIFPPTAGKALRERYALARAEAMANEYERSGGSWLEVA